MNSAIAIGSKAVMEADDLQQFIDALAAEHFTVYGPRIEDEAIAYAPITRLDELPAGKTDVQDAGRYRLEERGDGAYFGFTHATQSWKRLLHPPEETIWRTQRDGKALRFAEPPPDAGKRAFLGVRACDLNAILVQDRILDSGPYPDNGYRHRRRNLLIVAVNCTAPGGTCFCASMGTGPECETGFDLALTETITGEGHRFLVEVGSNQGAALLGRLRVRPAARDDIDVAERAIATASSQMGRSLETAGLPEVLKQNLEHPRWQAVAERCLTCGNCTMVCPTCFCTTVTENTALDGKGAETRRSWDTCFSLDFSYIHGGSVRTSAAARYRQWMTHKLAHWWDQFGTSGCVGCGRCITWCPVGIDITEEAAAIRSTPHNR